MSADAVRVRQMVADDLERVIEIANGLAEAPHWEIAAYQSALDPDALVRGLGETFAFASLANASAPAVPEAVRGLIARIERLPSIRELIAATVVPPN